MSVNGIYGLSSGLDIESLVTQGMTAKQTQYDSIYKKEQKAEWTKDAYNTWYQKLIDFQNNTLYQYALSSSTDPKTATSSAASVVTATAGGAAASLSHKVTVSTLASNAYLKTTDDGITRATGDSTSVKLSDLVGMSDVTLTASTSTTSDSDTLTYTDSSGTQITLTGSQMDETAISFTVRDGATTTDSDSSTSANSYKTISYTYRDLAESTLTDLATDLTDSGTNIGGTYDSVNDSFSIYNKKGGSSNVIDLTVDTVTNNLTDENVTSTSNDNTRTLLSALHLGAYNVSTDQLGTAIDASTTDGFADTPDSVSSASSSTAVAGTNGKVTIDGKNYDSTGTQITADGVTYTLLSTGSSTVTVSNDTDTIIKNVKQFVSDYNTLLSSLKDAIYTEPESDYTPLTTAEKADMSEDQITAWETKAKTGLLYKDDTLSDLVDSMRSAVNTKVSGLSGSYTSLASLGITVSSDWDTDSSGILSLDEDTLSTALASDPEAVYKVFNNPSYDKNDSSTYGVVKRLNTALSTAIGSGSLGTDATGLKGEAGTTDSSNYSDQSYWGDRIADLKEKLSDFKDAMDKYEDSLYDKYDAMETAISNLNSQYSYISSYTSS
ncbi:flagellar filament capping protein FliD [Pectinatus haikarae]|uniref:Flagellar hook-associated protein 2 n=1 Tax=Pectinatus haikarae TaxID=349096 RepID=A0ABT9YD86_9FIRM|nr:flagellar filament capping protein FliD [Pectinatus haikarae]MDQ0205152.1 flagellar hook-associated protein 2 [Pectinatus haikarae]